eukprot:CAMPEP_0194105952 /NCGR_PEP_ID=MMETSP0150-20130528/6063_1 /TAXON_ID=122233 /ORGANISM="Chaetoceros debilis, Strain MM31A-1" /LENGTH=503 /DNA_ID=CAMNT_0038793965 /DNA_START=92 /DNA_END=1600 /DNA_ORIENTATION=+
MTRRSGRIASQCSKSLFTKTNAKVKKEENQPIIKVEPLTNPIKVEPLTNPNTIPKTPSPKKRKNASSSRSSPRTPKRLSPKRSPTRSSPSPRRKSPKKFIPKSILCSSDIAKISPDNSWIDLKVPPHELRPSATLTTGQCFNWNVVHDDIRIRMMEENKDMDILTSASASAWGTFNETEWVGPISNMILSIKETPDTTMYRILYQSPTCDVNHINMSEFLTDYFQLETALLPLYQSWSQNDERLSQIAAVIPGLRIIRQDPVECLFSFICSSNNNIPRITKMLSSFRETYGEKMMDLPVRLLECDGLSLEPLELTMAIYSFPTLEELKSSTEKELREMGLGYRAKYIIETRDMLIDFGGKEYLLSLRKQSDSKAVQEELIQFSGIGRKVADCVALFSLDQHNAIPVDVHVQHIASRDYDPTVLDGAKSLTPTIYQKVARLFQDRFEYAGWAHSLLFVAELKSFRDVLPAEMVADMDKWREAENARKAALKEAKKENARKAALK